MSTRIIHRPARTNRTITPQKPIELAAVPTIRLRGQGANTISFILPVVGGIGMGLMMISSGNPIRMAVGAVMFVAVIISATVMFIRSKTGKRKEAESDRTRFLEHLEETEDEVRARAKQQQAMAAMRNPAPETLADAIRNPFRLWERRRGDEDFLVTRIGVGTSHLACGLQMKENTDPLATPEPISQAHAERMLRRAQTIANSPIAIPARGVVSLVGQPDKTTTTVRAICTQAAVFHAPDDVRIHLAMPLADTTDDARWALWLPHILSEDEFDGPIGRRQVSYDEASAASLLSELERRGEELKERSRYQANMLDEPYLVVVADMDTPHGNWVAQQLQHLVGSLYKARVVLIATARRQQDEPSHVDVRVVIDSAGQFRTQLLDRGEIREPEDGEKGYVERLLYGGFVGELDDLSPAAALAVARELSPLRLSEDKSPDAPLEQTVGLDAMMGIEDFATYEIHHQWQSGSPADFLRVPFGIDAQAQPIYLDIKESAKNGMGPHGLCVGATGSGKSEVLRTIVLAQIINHAPDQLSLVLVDFKGGATFAGFEPLPHIAAVVDNLGDGVGLVDRLHDSILGEIQRRQRVLQQAGNLANVGEYGKVRDQQIAASRPDGVGEGSENQGVEILEPLPVLFVVIDEFGELLASKPEFIELFVQIGRIGRSIGMHLLLASQRLEEGRLRGLESYLSYRIGLRTFSAAESRTALGTTAAHELPPIPGSGYLKVDPDIFDRFKAAYVSGPYESAAAQEERDLPPVPMPLELFNTTESWLQQREESYRQQVRARHAARALPKEQKSTLDVVVSRIIPAAEATRKIWLPPLPDRLGLELALGNVEPTSQRGLTAQTRTRLQLPIGLKDKPLEQWQGPMIIDVAGSQGNIAVLGAPQSGKTTTLKTLVLSLALTHTPTEAALYIVDLNGSGFTELNQLPHVGDVATRFEEDKMRRTFAEMLQFLNDRERIFAQRRISSVAEMRELHSLGRLPELRSADIFLVIDGWMRLKKDFEDAAETVMTLAERGLGYGIHVVLSTGRWADFKLQLQSVIGTKIEHRLNDPLDSSVGKKPQESLAQQPLGRAMSNDGLFGQISLPILEQPGLAVTEDTSALVAAIAAEYQGPGAQAVRMLPERVDYSALISGKESSENGLVGLAESTLQPVRFDFDAGQRHLLIVGDAGSGKTTTVRTLLREVVRNKEPGEVMFGVFDPRRSLIGECPVEFLGEYAGTRPNAEILAKGIAKELERRLPPTNVTPEQLRDKSWWQGPEIYLILDDSEHYEGNQNPLRPIVPYLAHAADIGLHVWVTRRSAGVSRSAYDPLVQGIRDNGANGVLLSGDRQEGALWPKTYLQQLPPGRALFVRGSRRTELIQVAYVRPRIDG